jgi:hypothetical protein
LAKIRRAALAGVLAVVICLLIGSQFCVGTQAQTATAFSPLDKFSIPTQNSTISFAVNGSYSQATLENSTWTFKNLKLDLQNATFLGINASDTTRNLSISAENSNVTVLAYLTITNTINVDLLSYTAEGSGTQTINLELNSTRSSPDDWSVFVSNGVFLPEGQDWTLQPDNTIEVTGQTGNVTVAHFTFDDTARNLSFLLQHYLVIFIALVLVAVVAVAAVIKRKAKKTNKTD